MYIDSVRMYDYEQEIKREATIRPLVSADIQPEDKLAVYLYIFFKKRQNGNIDFVSLRNKISILDYSKSKQWQFL